MLFRSRRFIGVIEVFIRRFTIFYKKKNKINLFSNRTYAEVHLREKINKIKSQTKGGYRGSVFASVLQFVVIPIQGCGGGGIVRRRNTLHVVGGRE